jgi:broad specificity polyphosphatase/5'/3'-nucleotidase SurE
MRLLVTTAEPISAELLRSVAEDLPQDAEVLVVAPATTHSPLRFWVSDVDEAIAHADAVQAETVERLEEDGIDAAGAVGESEPLQAIADALATFAADRVVVIEHEDGARDYREDGRAPDGGLAAEVRERFGLPVDVGSVSR